MTEDRSFRERMYARHAPVNGAVLIVGAGAVGSGLAEHLARRGIDRLRLVDHDVVAVENLARHELGASFVGLPKASTLASHIRAERPGCDAVGIDADFLMLDTEVQRQLVREADVVVAAADTIECQRRVNEVCLDVGATAVFPSFWVDPESGTRDAEVGEIFWYRSGRRMPCYSCFTSWRPEETGAAARGGTDPDIQFISLATLQVITALLDPDDERARILDDERTLILVHGFMPFLSDELREMFSDADDGGMLHLRVPFPSTPCRACRGQGPQNSNRHSPNRADTRRQARESLDDAFGTSVEEIHATLATTAGFIRLRLFPRRAPIAVRNFVDLANGNREYTDPQTGQRSSRPYYDGKLFHRVISGFMIQGGGTADGGWSGPGYQFDDEIDPDLTFHQPYRLAMANTGRNTNGAQFLITVEPAPHLNGRHTIFGEVADAASREVVSAIAGAQTTANDRPVRDIVIERVIVEGTTPSAPPPFPPTTSPTTRPPPVPTSNSSRRPPPDSPSSASRNPNHAISQVWPSLRQSNFRPTAFEMCLVGSFLVVVLLVCGLLRSTHSEQPPSGAPPAQVPGLPMAAIPPPVPTGAILLATRDVASNLTLAQDGGGVDTGLFVHRGDRITIAATGLAHYGLQGSAWNGCGGATGYAVTDADGTLRIGNTSCSQKKFDNGCTVPDAPVGSLIGRVGDGSWFFVGGKAVLEIRADGKLWLGHNDSYSGDNSGSFSVSIYK